MDRNRFDRLTRLFAATGSRRHALSALISAAMLGPDADILARKGNGKDDNNKGKHGRGRGTSGKSKGRGRGNQRRDRNDRAPDAPASDPAPADSATADAASGATPQNTLSDGQEGKRRKHKNGKGGNTRNKKTRNKNKQPAVDPASSEPGSEAAAAAPDDASSLTIEATAQVEPCWRAGACIVKKGANVSQCNLAGYVAPDPLDCTGCNFSRANLRGADLTGVNFTKANLSGACLIDANFTGATFANTTNLSSATFCRTIMPDGSVNNSGCASGTACCSACNAGFKQCGSACIANDQCCTNGASGCAQGQTCCGGTCQQCCGSNASTCPAVPPVATCKVQSCQNGTCSLVNGPNGEPGNDCAAPRFCQGGVCVDCVTSATCPPAPTCKVATCDDGKCGTANQENGAACSLSGGSEGVCANGECVQCINPGTCPPPPICHVATCTDNQCGTANDKDGPSAACPNPGCCNGACCTGTQVCFNNTCCQPVSTCPAHACGDVPDGCGSTINCGACPVQTCQDASCSEETQTCNYTPVNNGQQGPNCDGTGQSCCNGACCTSEQVCAASRCCPRQTPDSCGGTCTNTNTDLNNCGVCGKVCSFPHASATCVAGTCELGACDQGFANCDGDPATGCETPLGTNQNCSGCGNACSGGTVCQNFTCVTPCDVCASGCRYTTVQAAIDDFSGPTTIRICPGTYGQITLSRGVTLIGAGQGADPASNTIISAAGGPLPAAVFISSREVSLQGLRITGGNIGVITWDSFVTMTDCTVTGNHNGPGGSGAGVGLYVDFNPGRVVLNNCTISGNSVVGNGAGIYLEPRASVTLNGGTVTGNSATGFRNSGGGIYNNQGVVTLNGASVTGNMPDNCGGVTPVSGCVG